MSPCPRAPRPGRPPAAHPSSSPIPPAPPHQPGPAAQPAPARARSDGSPCATESWAAPRAVQPDQHILRITPTTDNRPDQQLRAPEAALAVALGLLATPLPSPSYRRGMKTPRPLRQPARPLLQRRGPALRPRLLWTAPTTTADIGALPHFNPDLDGEDATPPAPVAALRTAVRRRDAVLIVSPEYAHGVPGVLKNALDWLVSSGECVHKPIAVITASPFPTGGDHANAQLRETLRMMTGDGRHGRLPRDPRRSARRSTPRRNASRTRPPSPTCARPCSRPGSRNRHRSPSDTLTDPATPATPRP